MNYQNKKDQEQYFFNKIINILCDYRSRLRLLSFENQFLNENELENLNYSVDPIFIIFDKYQNHLITFENAQNFFDNFNFNF